MVSIYFDFIYRIQAVSVIILLCMSLAGKSHADSTFASYSNIAVHQHESHA